MKSLYDFIVKPLGDKYKNTVKIAGKDVIVNTKIENWKFVNRLAEVVKTPLAFKSGIKKGDIIVIHQNVFRTFYDMKGNKKKSRSYFENDLYFCSLDQVYLYKNKNGWNTVGDRCFITPIKSNDSLTLDKERKLVGIIKYGNKSLEALGITPGTLITFTPNSEFEFVVGDERLYCMKSNDIALTHDDQGDKVKYNPSWAQSS